ncbi:MAG: hypothetical protein OEZ01_13915 [Candidatus Heimdallarchaeota archaeon]|nr:hypothetical protein [Candidatus Heimdallarchaeota archaeon]
MSSSKFNGLMINRLLVLFQLIAIPIYFIFFTIYWHEDITQFFDNLVSKHAFWQKILPPWLIWFEINLAIPILFSLPWVLLTLMRATRIADAYLLMSRALGKVRIDQKLFYGLNAAFTLVFIILPFASPIITIIGIIILTRAIMRKAYLGKLSKIFWIIPAIILIFFPILISVAFYSNYTVLWDKIFNLWMTSINVIFGYGLCLAIAISIGNFFLFLSEGSAKYNRDQLVRYDLVFLIKVILFIILSMIYFTTDPPVIVHFMNYVALALAIIEFILRKARNLPLEGSMGSGIVMVVAFSIVNILINLLSKIPNFADIMQSLVVLISGLIFFILFILSYKYADDEELVKKV